METNIRIGSADLLPSILNDAMHQVGYGDLARIQAEWPHLAGAYKRLTRLSGGLLMPATDGDSLLVRSLSLGCEAVRVAEAKGDDTLAAFVLAVSRKLPDMLSFIVQMKVRANWVSWNPIEDYLLDEIKRSKATEIRIVSNPHPLSTVTQTRMIVASRVFSLNDLVRAGVIYVDVSKVAA